MITIKNLLKETEKNFAKAGIDSPAFDAMCLIEKIFDLSKTDFILQGNNIADENKIKELNILANRRIQGEPLQYLLGSWEFYGYKFLVGKGVLIPRDDTEVLLRICLDFLKNLTAPRVLDLCSGSGALAVAISKETSAQVTAVEKSPDAFSYLKKNIALNNAPVKAVQGDIFTCMDLFENNSFDLILSNPPYIKTDEISTLQKEISFEPKMALDGGSDGYKFYQHIIEHWTKKLKPKGMLAFELGENQFATVKALMESQGYEKIGKELDLGNIERAIYGTLF